MSSNLHPCFDTTIDLINFSVSDPMNYQAKRLAVQYTESGITYSGKPEISSSSSSDEEYVDVVKKS